MGSFVPPELGRESLAEDPGVALEAIEKSQVRNVRGNELPRIVADAEQATAPVPSASRFPMGRRYCHGILPNGLNGSARQP